MIRRVTTRAVIIKNGMIFCVKQRNSAGQTVDYWCTPGGGLDIREPLVTGLKREIIEETGVNPEIGNLVLIQQFVDSKGREQMEFFFHVTNADDFENIDLNKTTHGSHEIDEFGFVDPATTYILPKILRQIDLSNIDKIERPMIINQIPLNAEKISTD